jgi:hypothetical protein
MKTASQMKEERQTVTNILYHLNIPTPRMRVYSIKGGILKIWFYSFHIYINYDKYINENIIEEIKYTNN